MKGAEVKNVGIEGVSPPADKCNDDECPFHGSLRVRGITMVGKVEKFKSPKMAVVSRNYVFFDRKYKRYLTKTSKIHVRVPSCIKISVGDAVLIGETRKLAKSVSFVLLGKVKQSA
jgi:small subunit ribosomal protein S17